jgi:HlyD family secretion protein
MKLQKKTMVLTVLSALVLAGLLGWAFAPRPLEVETAQVTEGPFETTLEEDGRTRLRERYLVSAPLGGRLSAHCTEGGRRGAGRRGAGHAGARAVAMLDERSRLEAGRPRRDGAALLQRADSRIGAGRAGAATGQRRPAAHRTPGRPGLPGAQPARRCPPRRRRPRSSELDTARLGEEVARRELAQARAAVSHCAARTGRRWPAAFGVRAPVSWAGCSSSIRPARRWWPWEPRCWNWATPAGWRWWQTC